MTAPDEPLPIGFRIRSGPAVRRLADAAGRPGTALVGGAPTRLMRLRPRAAKMLESGEMTVVDAASGLLARKLLDAGIAHPALSAADVPPGDVTVIVPVRDDQTGVDRLVPALVGTAVIVVDDGSAVPVDAPAARVIRHAAARGPAAARNTGLAAADTEFVAFLDADTVPRGGWLDALMAHFSDPTVALAAARIAALGGYGGQSASGGYGVRSGLARYEAVRSSLDIGPVPGPVVPGTPVSYVPSAAIVVRRAAVAGDGADTPEGSGGSVGRDGFDASMHVAEDVDLCWRLHESGWRLRYEPEAIVEHEHRVQLREWLGRKAFYGEGAAPLADRHPGAVAPMILAPWSAAAGVGVLSGTRVGLGVAAVAGTGAGVKIRRTLSGLARPGPAAARLLGLGFTTALWQMALGVCRHYWPPAVIAALVSGRARRVVLCVAVAEGLADWCVRDARGGDGRWRRPALDPVRYLLFKRLDDAGYGTGLWRGAIRRRSPRALMPRRG